MYISFHGELQFLKYIFPYIYIFGCTFLMVGFFSLTISSIGGSWPPPLRLHRRLPGKLHGEEQSQGDNLASRPHLLLSSDPGRNTSAELPNKIVTKHKHTQSMLKEFPRTNNNCRLFCNRKAWLVATLLTGPKGSSARVLRLVFF